jgi:hypothetical protein
MATTIEKGQARGTTQTFVCRAASAYLDVAASSARIGPLVLLDVFLACAWAVAATLATTAAGAALPEPVRTAFPAAGTGVDFLIWLGALAIPFALGAYRERPGRGPDARPGDLP